MTGPQYKTALAALGMTQAAAAKFFKVSLRTANIWANGGAIPEAVAKLLRLMVRLGLKPQDVR
jgi:hypothetical protein